MNAECPDFRAELQRIAPLLLLLAVFGLLAVAAAFA